MKPSSDQFQSGFEETPPPATANQPASGTLGLWDAVSIIVGIVVGAGIYQTAPFILKNVANPTSALLAWGAAGLLSLVGALCYAELATTYPRTGGDIVYLTRAFGRWAGFLFGWVQLTVILTGSIGMMAFVFANYGIELIEAYQPLADDGTKGSLSANTKLFLNFGLAGGAVALLTLTNILGVVFGKVIQNVLTLAKVIGLGAIIVAGFMAPEPGAWAQTGLSLEDLRKLTFPVFSPSLGVALVLILYTYGGWNDAAFVAAEVRDGKKNITRALILGIAIITVLYLLVNIAYINALGYQGAQGANQIAAQVLNKGFGKGGLTLMCVLVMISALGAVNGLIFTGARVYSTIGQEYSTLAWMSGWNRESKTPIPALVTQGVITLALIFLVGTTWGRDFINQIVTLGPLPGYIAGMEASPLRDFLQVSVGLIQFNKLDWEGAGGFDTLLTSTAPIFWLFFLLTGLAVFVLRERDKHIERPFKVPLYPELPLVFCLSCAYMLYSSTDYAISRGWKGGVFLLGIVPLILGLILYRFSRVTDDSQRV